MGYFIELQRDLFECKVLPFFFSDNVEAYP